MPIPRLLAIVQTAHAHIATALHLTSQVEANLPNSDDDLDAALDHVEAATQHLTAALSDLENYLRT